MSHSPPQLLLPSGVTVEVIVVNIVSAGHVFVQQHTHPTYHALRSLDQQMFLCYSQPGTPALPSPAEGSLTLTVAQIWLCEVSQCLWLIVVLIVLLCVSAVGVICAAPAVDGAWWRAQVITFYKETNEVEIRYVDYGGYDRVKIDSLRQIRWVTPAAAVPLTWLVGEAAWFTQWHHLVLKVWSTFLKGVVFLCCFSFMWWPYSIPCKYSSSVEACAWGYFQ